jgi:hypothetical protein
MQATISSTEAERVPFWSALITDRRIAPALGLGFTSGMPFLLTPRIGMMSGLLIGTVAGSASHLALALLAAHGGKAFERSGYKRRCNRGHDWPASLLSAAGGRVGHI